MFRINSPGSTVDGRFKVSPAPATRVTHDWLNAVQEEMATVIEDGGGITLNPADSGQMLAAIQAMIDQSAGGLGVRKRGVVGGVKNAGTYYQPFPVAFPSVCDVVVATAINTSGSDLRDVFVQVRSWNEDGFYYVIQSTNTGGNNTCDGITWIAEGS